MINQPTNYAPVVPQALTAPAPEFNAIKININGATVGAPSQAPVIMPQPAPIPAPEAVGQNVDYTA